MRTIQACKESVLLTAQKSPHKVTAKVGHSLSDSLRLSTVPDGNKTDRARVVTLGEKEQLARFDETIMPHLDAAYNLARWLTRNDDDAQDIVQEAYLRAFRFFDAFRGVDGRAWLLTIVRNTCYTWLQQNRAHDATPFDEEIHHSGGEASNPATLALQNADQMLVREAIDDLPAEFREVVVLRDLEGFSYKQIAEISKIPTGTVMSRLARARERLKQFLIRRAKKEA